MGINLVMIFEGFKGFNKFEGEDFRRRAKSFLPF
jgi:hypothetical protein